MIKLESKDYSSVEKMLAKFKRKVKDSKIILEMNERKRHISKKEKNRKKKSKNKYRIEKDKNKFNNDKI